MSSMAAAASSQPRSQHFRTKAATTLTVFVGGPCVAYYWNVLRPRARYQAHLAALNAVPRPLRRTKLFVGGDEPLVKLHDMASRMKVDLRGIGGGNLLARMMPFYVHVVWRLVLLACRAVPVAARYVAARWGLFGVTYTSAHQSVCALLAAMGPSFIKLGQWAATRPDVFPPELCKELESLFDSAPPHAFADTIAALEQAGIAEKLTDISHEPINSGSIAQVHRAVLKEDYVVSKRGTDPGTLAALTDGHLTVGADGAITPAEKHSHGSAMPMPSVAANPLVPASLASKGMSISAHNDDDVIICKAGTPVVVKVMHPGVREQIFADSAALQLVGSTLSKLIPGSEFLSIRQTAEEVCALAVSQLNLLREADNLIDFRFNFRRGLYDDVEGKVAFPLPLVNISTESVLVETFEVGEPLSDANHKHYASMGKVAMDMFMRMLFEHNLVHADLHPGNILFRMVNPDGSVATARNAGFGSKPQMVILDPGLVTSLSEKERKNFVSLFAAVASGDGELGARLMFENAPPPQTCTDVEQFVKDMKHVFDTINPVNLGSFSFAGISIGEKLSDVMSVMRRNKVRIDMNFATLVSTVLVGEGMGKRLEPDFNLVEHALPFLVQCLKSHEMEFLVAKLQETYLTVNLA